MSISTPAGDSSRQTAPPAAKKAVAGAGRPPSARSGGGRPAGGGRPGGGGGRGPRKPVTPVKVSQGRSWGPIALFAGVGLVAVLIIGYGVYAVVKGPKSWQDRADAIAGISDFYKTNPDLVQGGNHQQGPIKYEQSPPVAGPHNNDWMNCMGDVYDAPIANEHAVHSLEHGAVWITYRPDLAADQVQELASKVQGTEKLLMSPYEGLDKPISLQAWGYQLKVDNADDKRIDEFISALRVNASQEGPTALCSQGITATGTTPRDMSGQGEPAPENLTGQ